MNAAAPYFVHVNGDPAGFGLPWEDRDAVLVCFRAEQLSGRVTGVADADVALMIAEAANQAAPGMVPVRLSMFRRLTAGWPSDWPQGRPLGWFAYDPAADAIDPTPRLAVAKDSNVAVRIQLLDTDEAAQLGLPPTPEGWARGWLVNAATGAESVVLLEGTYAAQLMESWHLGDGSLPRMPFAAIVGHQEAPPEAWRPTDDALARLTLQDGA
ncbi:hypothetical protein SPF06_02515 [Sinomonas sp. JGH33]|uniref:Uncharacterized protein n=1 Tax=Sinomonas terricola TaxID=3110330 RepID=A0ABU5T1R1_9MICC|nr:hypothetical protein [Sinomonas sp. JGH33]MEA5453586.1 hypothetical protein [Sinomonas sp. JGH33]